MRWTLSVKIALGISAILIAVMSVSVIWNAIFVRNQLMADSRHYAIHLSEVAEAGLENAMIIKDPEKIKSIMLSIGSRADIVGAAVFNKRGEIKYSINPSDVGRTFSKSDPMCIICHGGTLSDQTQTVISPSKQGARILKVVRPIINQPLCQGCHQERVLGMLMVDLSLAEVDQQAAAVLGQQFRQSLATVVIVIIALIGFMYLIVTRPLAHFIRITRAIDNGDLDKRVNLTHKDEIGELGASFNRMVENMAARTQELERLNEIAATQITERKRAEEVTRESEERYRSLVELSPEAVVVHSEGKIAYINKSGEQIFGASNSGEMIGKPIKDFVHPDYWERVIERVKQIQEKKEPAPLQELIFNRLNGEAFNVETAGVPITLSGKIASLTIVRDISERKRMEEELHLKQDVSERLAQEIAIIAEIGRLIGSTLKVEEVYDRFAAEARKLIPFDRLIVDLINLNENTLKVAYTFGMELPQRRLGDTFPLNGSMNEFLVHTRTGILIPSVDIGAMVGRFPRLARTYQAGLLSVMSVPLISGDVVIGALHFRAKERDIYTEQDLRLAEKIGTQIAGAIANAQMFSDLIKTEQELKESEHRYRELSIVDDLTQLYNSRHFYFQLKIELDRSNRYEQPLTLLLLDLDNFKAFNDTYGHVEGDQVLRRLGQVVKRCLRETDFAYRYGGEEFTILLPMTKSADGAVTAERIRMEFKKETFSPASGQDIHLTMSIGLAQYRPQEEMKTFVRRVDQLMYQGKKNGKDRVCCES